MHITKCDFCVQSSPEGKCFWSNKFLRENDCKKAIKKMTEALKYSGFKEKNKHKS